MVEFGLKVKHDTGGTRVELQCKHQNGLLYVVPSEASWVCSDDLIHVHAIAGFFTELLELKDKRVTDAMRRWGIYFRKRPLVPGDEDDEKA